MDIKKAVSIAINELREEKGYTRTELAAKAGVATSFIYYIEENKKTPGIDRLEKICQALEISVTQFMDRVERIKTREL